MLKTPRQLATGLDLPGDNYVFGVRSYILSVYFNCISVLQNSGVKIQYYVWDVFVLGFVKELLFHLCPEATHFIYKTFRFWISATPVELVELFQEFTLFL